MTTPDEFMARLEEVERRLDAVEARLDTDHAPTMDEAGPEDTSPPPPPPVNERDRRAQEEAERRPVVSGRPDREGRILPRSKPEPTDTAVRTSRRPLPSDEPTEPVPPRRPEPETATAPTKGKP